MGKRMKDKRALHVKRLAALDAQLAAAAGICRSSTRKARQLVHLVTLLTAAMAASGCDVEWWPAQGRGMSVTCTHWISQCAQRRSLVDCQADARALGCP